MTLPRICFRSSRLAVSMLLTLYVLAALPALVLAQTNATPAKRDTKENPSDTKDDTKFFEEPPLSVTTHSVTVGGKTLKYHATAGYIVLKEEEGKPLVKSPSSKPGSESKPESKAESEANKTKDGLK